LETVAATANSVRRQVCDHTCSRLNLTATSKRIQPARAR
jgi:hypothetical protein